MDLLISHSIAIALALATSEGGVVNQVSAVSIAAPPIAQTSDSRERPSLASNTFLAMRPVESDRLANVRGGTDTHEVANFMNLRGGVSDTRASDLITGNNSISDGAFSGAVGLPMVIQNSGNNVLIQNATIINVRVY